MGFALLHRSSASGASPTVRIAVHGRPETYALLATFAFSSDRKRMSVVLRDEASGEVRILTKGADDKIAALLREPMGPSDAAALESFAAAGLRTLCLAQRVVPAEEFARWQARHEAATVVIVGREQALEQVYEELERDLSLVGISAIEDKLQDGAAETIAQLRAAGIRFWMLTGDKYSTAVQVATASRLITPSPGGELARVSGESAAEVRASIEACLRAHSIASARDYAVIIEGSALAFALESERVGLRRLGLLCGAVICCRVTPAQKAQVVALVKESGAMCLAVGDGGNDVSMIQEAQIGVGIAGREGLQAARSADFSITRFHHLSRLLLVHGHYSLYRSSLLSQYSFYKSIVMAVIQLGYAFYSGLAGTTFFNTFSLTTYNVIFTGAPIVALTITERHIPASTLLANPRVYAEARRGAYLCLQTLLSWGAFALYHGAVMLVLGVTIYGPGYLSPTGDPEDYESIPIAVFVTLIIQQTSVVALSAHCFTG
jgi:phospholipid-translocating ATPase